MVVDADRVDAQRGGGGRRDPERLLVRRLGSADRETGDDPIAADEPRGVVDCRSRRLSALPVVEYHEPVGDRGDRGVAQPRLARLAPMSDMYARRNRLGDRSNKLDDDALAGCLKGGQLRMTGDQLVHSHGGRRAAKLGFEATRRPARKIRRRELAAGVAEAE